MSRKETGSRHFYKSELVSHIFLQYILCLIGFAMAVALTLVLGVFFATGRVWRGNEPLYLMLSWIRDYLPLVLIAICAVGWILITGFFLVRPFRYLDEIVNAAEQMAQPGDEPIRLSAALKSVQDEMNLVREQALRSAYLAREAEQRKNDMIMYLAHDLKTPLTSVIGYLSLLSEEPDISAETRARYTGIAMEKAQRLEDLVNEFFDITRFSLSRLTLECESVNLSRMLEQMTYEFLPVMDEKSLSWRTEIDPELELVCDPDKLARVFDNLIRNAVGYSYPESVIFLSARKLDREIEIQVRNQGRTIPAEKLDRIFDQFFRMDSSRASSTGGAGLGLAIAKEIVELHGGVISAQSADETIVFTVLLPLERQKIV